MNAVLERRITQRELSLLCVVESFVRNGGKGCFASNAYLATTLKCHHIHVARMVGALKKQGFLIAYNVGRQRHLETSWSRAGESSSRPSSEDTDEEGQLTLGANPGLAPGAKHKYSSTKNTNKVEPASPGDAGAHSLKSSKLSKGAKPRMLAKENITRASFHEEAQCPRENDFHRACADKLRACAVRLKTAVRWSRSKWAREFRLIEKRIAGDAERLGRVLDYYCAKAGAKGLPKCVNASHFGKCFDWIEERMNKKDAGQVELSSKASALVADVITLGWSKACKAELPAAAQRTLDNAQAFVDGLKALVKKLEGMRRERYIKGRKCYTEHPSLCRARLLLQEFGAADRFTWRWLRHLWRVTQPDNWPDFNGRLSALAWSPELSMGLMHARNMMNSITSDAYAFDKILQLMKEMNNG